MQPAGLDSPAQHHTRAVREATVNRGAMVGAGEGPVKERQTMSRFHFEGTDSERCSPTLGRGASAADLQAQGGAR